MTVPAVARWTKADDNAAGIITIKARLAQGTIKAFLHSVRTK